MITRTLGNALFGEATLAQITLSCMLACIWGFLPGMYVAPGSMLVLAVVLLIFNTNLPLFAILAGLSHLLSLLLLPLTFRLGVFLLEGPTSPLFVALINGSGTALLGFDHYVTAGGWALGSVLGVLGGWQLGRGVGNLRRHLSKQEQENKDFRNWREKPYVRFLSWLLLGVKTQDMATRFEKKGGTIRWWGVALAILSLAALFFVRPVVEHFVAAGIKKGLTQANGATVDVAEIDFSLSDGRLSMTQLALCDPNQLERDRFRAETLTMDVSISALLAKRVVLDHVVASAGRLDVPREQAGELVGEGKPRRAVELDKLDYKQLETYLEKAREIKDRLRSLRALLEDISGRLPEEQEGATLEDWLANQVDIHGYTGVRATHLIKQTPAFLMRRFEAKSVSAEFLAGDTLDVEAFVISTHPQFEAEPPRLTVNSKNLDLALSLDEATANPAPSKIALSWRNYPMEKVNQHLKAEQYLHEGTVNFEIAGEIKARAGGWISLPLTATLNQVVLELPKIEAVTLSEFPITIHLEGPLDNPGVKFDHKAFMETLRKNGLDAVANRYKQEINAKVDEKVDEVKAEAQSRVKEELNEKLGGEVDGLLKGDGKEKPALEDALGGFLNKKKKKPTETDQELKPETDQEQHR